MNDFKEKPMTSKVKAEAISLVWQMLDYSKEDKERNRSLSVMLDEGLGLLEVVFFEKNAEGAFETADIKKIYLREDNFGKTFHEIIQEFNELSDNMEKFHNGEDWKKENSNE